MGFFTGLFVLGLLQCRFSLAQAIGHVLLTPGQVSQAVEHLQVFPLLRLILILSQTFFLVSIGLLAQFQLLQLPFKLLRIL